MDNRLEILRAMIRRRREALAGDGGYNPFRGPDKRFGGGQKKGKKKKKEK